MLIVHYVGLGLVALGVVLAAIGGAFGLRRYEVNRVPPRSEEEEFGRGRLGHAALALAIIGVLTFGVGALFR
jgi:hypothetical protein